MEYYWTQSGHGIFELHHEACLNAHARILNSYTHWYVMILLDCDLDYFQHTIRDYTSEEEAKQDMNKLFGIKEA